MKRILFILVFVILAGITVSAQDTLVTFKFKVAKDSSQTSGNAYNVDDIMLRDATYNILYAYTTGIDGTGDFCLSSTLWYGGLDSAKCYYTTISTSAHMNILVSSRQKSSSTGPKDFMLQYRLGTTGTWTDVTGGTVVCANDNFVSGTLTNVALPTECNNYPQLFLRWVMTSNTSVGGGTVASAGTSRIDNVVVVGDLITGVEDDAFRNSVSIYPNPSNGIFTVNNIPDQKLDIEVFDMLGNSVYKSRSSEKMITVDISKSAKGIYFVELTNAAGSKVTRKMVVK